ncbi:unnamed protein product [Schistosoma rodhaini]|uniref:Cyclic nucleotide-binding domain-containing protein n=1 Tax=Schistosoma rodhaini TaxID=6188 RepID=A0AA85G1R3_9TREM|nr:unnamed protein product [Schistosoma rodhaini]CAH8600473.1 unnamed protein product [Schistosoma rodhaini]
MSNTKDTLATVESSNHPTSNDDDNKCLLSDDVSCRLKEEEEEGYEMNRNSSQKSVHFSNFSRKSLDSPTKITNTKFKNLNLSPEKINSSIKEEHTTSSNSSINGVGKNWKNVRHTMKFVLSNKSKSKSEHDDSSRDSFLYRFSTQRRGTYTRENENLNETPLVTYQTSFKNKNNIKSQNDDYTQSDTFIESWFNQQQQQQQPEMDDKQHEMEHLMKSSSSQCSIVDNLVTKPEIEPFDTGENYSPEKLNTNNHQIEIDIEKSINWKKEILNTLKIPMNFFIFHSNSSGYLIWLTFVSIALLYNLWAPIARQAFTELQITYQILWFSLDVFTDLTYLIDIFVQCNTSYLKRGLKVRNHQKLAKRYMKSYKFLLDITSLLPLDLLQFKIGIQPMLRFPRFLKWYRCREWKIRVENRTIFPNLWRVLNLIHILFLGCHWFAAFYYLLSKYEGFKNPWGYQPHYNNENDTISRIYLKSFYWATLTLTTIGDLSAPTSSIELTFTIVSYLTGVFVFATIVGQVGNIITTRNADRIEFEKILDHAKSYMRANSVDKDLQSRILRWYDYAWSKGCGGGGQDINTIGLLPDKLKTELALNVNLETLKKVTIFHECRPEFLHDIVLKMRPLVFTPGDLICRKGEIAREIFIIADGVLEVISDSNEVLSKMSAGDFFGEIGVLNVDGVNKRTADVRAVGYAELFVLSREDILKALKDHPDAEAVIRKHATRRLCETRVRQQAHLHGKRSPILSNNLCKSFILPGAHENTSIKLEVPSSGITRNSSMLLNNENDIQSQQTTISSGINTQWKSKNFSGRNDTSQLVETLDQFADRWETILMNLTKNYREEIGVLREQILQFSSTNTS